jgi:CBS domain-containing protein
MDLSKYKISDNTLIEQAIQMIELNSTRCVIVHNGLNKVIGIVSEGDILRSILKGISIMSPVKHIMNMNFIYLMEKDDDKILSLFKSGITLIPILDQNFQLIEAVELVQYFSDKNNK